MSRFRRISNSLRRLAFPLVFAHVYAKLQNCLPSLSSYETTVIVGELEDCIDDQDKLSLYSFKMEHDEDRWRLDFIRWDPDRRVFRVVVQGVVTSAEKEKGGKNGSGEEKDE